MRNSSFRHPLGVDDHQVVDLPPKTSDPQAVEASQAIDICTLQAGNGVSTPIRSGAGAMFAISEGPLSEIKVRAAVQASYKSDRSSLFPKVSKVDGFEALPVFVNLDVTPHGHAWFHIQTIGVLHGP